MPKGTKSIKLLRKSGNNPYYIVGNLSSDNKQYIDHKLKKYMSYTWAIQFKNDEHVIYALQSNDLHEIREHVNCVNSADELAAQANLSKTYFRGDKNLKRAGGSETFNRYMVIGKR